MSPREFVAFFRRTHREPGADDLCATRIEFSYVHDEKEAASR